MKQGVLEVARLSLKGLGLPTNGGNHPPNSGEIHMNSKAVFGIVASQTEAENILVALQGAGFTPSDVSVLFNDPRAARDFATETVTKAPEGAVAGGGVGAALGGTLGLLAGLGTIAIPGLGLLIAAWPIMAALSGAAVGAAAGALTGSLVGLGIPEIHAKLYEGKIHEGKLLIAVHAEDADQVDRAKSVLTSRGAEDVTVTREATVPEKKPTEKTANLR